MYWSQFTMLYIIIILWLLAVGCWRLTGVPFPFVQWAVAFYFFIPSSSSLFYSFFFDSFLLRFLYCHLRFFGVSDLKLFSIPVINGFCLRYAYKLAMENGFVCIHSQYHHIIFICPNNERPQRRQSVIHKSKYHFIICLTFRPGISKIYPEILMDFISSHSSFVWALVFRELSIHFLAHSARHNFELCDLFEIDMAFARFNLRSEWFNTQNT